MNPRNPYRPAPGSLPPFLAGRLGELSAISAATSLTAERAAVTPVIFTGLRGMGKTALLRSAAAESEQRGAIVLYGEAGDDLALEEAFRRSLLRAQRELRDAPRRLMDAIEAAIEHIPIPLFDLPGGGGGVSLHKPPLSARTSLPEALERLNEEAAKHGRFLALCIDEIQDAKTEHLRPVVSYVHETSASESPVLLFGAGLPGTPAHLKATKTYTERWRYFDLSLLTPEATAEAIRRPAAALHIAIDDDALTALVHESAGYPFFIQEYASVAWAQRVGDHISIETVRDIVPGVRRSLDAGLYENRFRALTPREIRYVLALADLGPGIHTIADVAGALDISSIELSSTRNQLIRKDVLVAPAYGVVEFRIPLSERFIESHRASLEQRAEIGAKKRPDKE